MSYDLFAEYYDELMGEVDYPARARYIDGLIKQCKPDARLLVDLACGTGSMTVEFAAKGYDVIGVDLSENMLSKAREKSDGSILYLCQSMQELDMYGTIDAFVCTLDSLNHIEDREQLLLALSRVSLFLEPDGVFVFDMNTLYKHEHILADNAFVYETEDVFCVWQNEYCGEGRVEIMLDFFEQQPDGSYLRESEFFTETAYSLEETKRLLEEAGLQLLAAYDDMTSLPPSPESERMVFVAGKKR
ncbi:MAG: class I SAM-dependent methyltransferase [Clostridia bacterium]|nr:class I SAM-dependent methyltransferase [Clostridia bacterium]